jgi:hypothetical protein
MNRFAWAAGAVLVTATCALLLDWFVGFSSTYIALRAVATAAWVISLVVAVRIAGGRVNLCWWLFLTAVPVLWQPLLDSYVLLTWRFRGAAP